MVVDAEKRKPDRKPGGCGTHGSKSAGAMLPKAVGRVLQGLVDLSAPAKHQHPEPQGPHAFQTVWPGARRREI